jgi:hypothetical protein
VRSQCAELAEPALAIHCAHGNLCPIPSKSYISSGSIRQKNTDIEGHKHRYRSTKLRYRIQISKVLLLISKFLRYRYVTISKFRYRSFFDIVLHRYQISWIQYRSIFDIVLSRYRMIQPSISKFFRFEVFDIECQNLRYRVVISYPISDDRRSFPDLRYERLKLRYRDIPISKVRPSISKFAKVPDGGLPTSCLTGILIEATTQT